MEAFKLGKDADEIYKYMGFTSLGKSCCYKKSQINKNKNKSDKRINKLRNDVKKLVDFLSKYENDNEKIRDILLMLNQLFNITTLSDFKRFLSDKNFIIKLKKKAKKSPNSLNNLNINYIEKLINDINK